MEAAQDLRSLRLRGGICPAVDFNRLMMMVIIILIKFKLHFIIALDDACEIKLSVR